jgi:Na+/citrate or Na+/malate symporter
MRRQTRPPTLGLDALALILASSYCVHANWIGKGVVDSVRAAVEVSHAITGFICILIVGSILSIDVRPLAKTFPRLVVVIVLASIAALLVGMIVGRLAGLVGSDVLFLIIVPLMGGGLNAGALPLALGYGDTFGDGKEIFATLLPPILLGNLVAVIVAGVLGYLGQMRRGRGLVDENRRLVRKFGDETVQVPSAGNVVIAILFLLCLAVAGYLVERTTGVSEPIFLLSVSGFLLSTNMVPQGVLHGIVAVYRLSAKILVFPVLIIVGLLYSPWDVLLDGFSRDNLLIASATVAALGFSGYLMSFWIGLDPIDGSIIAVSRTAMGGTGDIAMLSAARRLDLMPFAQFATRLGGAITVFIALLAL